MTVLKGHRKGIIKLVISNLKTFLVIIEDFYYNYDHNPVVTVSSQLSQ